MHKNLWLGMKINKIYTGSEFLKYSSLLLTKVYFKYLKCVKVKPQKVQTPYYWWFVYFNSEYGEV